MTNPRRAAAQLLRDWQSAGLTHLPKPRLQSAAENSPPAGPDAKISEQRTEATVELFPTREDSLLPGATAGSRRNDAPRDVNLRKSQLADLARCVAGCVRCPELARTRTQTVFGVGDPMARVMFIGEAPGADEDQQGEPFVGRAGQLLTRIIEACGWKRQDVYICNILRCRPPGNRTPTEQEAQNCREYLDGQIAIVDPEYIVCWGSCAAQNLLGTKDSISRMRQRLFQYGRAKVLCTYHPSYLLRNPAAKKPVWEDMKFLLADMGLTPPELGSNE